MDQIERYCFDLNGYIVVKNMLSPQETAQLLKAADRMESHVKENVDKEPFFTGEFGIRYHHDHALGYNSYKNEAGGLQLIVDDFFNASSDYDILINHAKTMQYVTELAMGPYNISSAELRYRYKGNITPSHMGGPIDPRNRYEFLGKSTLDPLTGSKKHRDFNLLTVRVIYALHDVPMDNGPFCVVPGTHKANFFSPYGHDPSLEPGMIGLPISAGDAIFFTENLRHGGLPNLLDTPRKTIHMMYSPSWTGSQSPAHWNRSVYITEKTYARYGAAQKALFSQATLDHLGHALKSGGGDPAPQRAPNAVARVSARILRKLFGG